MDDALRNGLREIAQEVPYLHVAPPPLLIRVLRRLARNAAVSAVVAVAVVIVLIAGVHAINRPVSIPATRMHGFPGPVAYTVTTKDAGQQVYLRDGNGAERALTQGSSPARALAWSPDGSGLLVVRTTGSGGSDLYVVHPDGSPDTRIANGLLFVDGASWSPDASRIVYAAGGHLFLIDPNGGVPTQLAIQGRPDLPARSPAWSPDGTRIAFLAGGEKEAPRLWSMASNGTDLQLLVGHRDGAPTAFAWSPDGTRIAFVGGFASSGLPGVFVREADGGVVRLFGDWKVAWISPAWFPDGSAVVFTTRIDGNQELYAISSAGLAWDGSGLTRLTMTRQGESGPLFQPGASPLAGTGG